MDLLRAVFHQYFLTPGQRPTIGVGLDPACEPWPTSGGEGRVMNHEKNADAPRDRSLIADPIEVLTIGRARTGTGRSRRSRTQFGCSSGCYCHHAHLA